MAVESVELLFTSRGGKQTLQNQRTYTRVFEVLTDDAEDDEQVVGTAEGIPVLGSPLEADPDAVAVDVDCQQSDESNLIWYVTVEYDTDPPQSADRDRPDERQDIDGNPIDKQQQQQQSPLDESVTWTTSFTNAEEPAIEGIKVGPTGKLDLPTPRNWFANVEYTNGEYVRNGANVYILTSLSVSVSGSGGGPVGQGEDINDAPDAWQPGHAYIAGDYVTNGTPQLVYKCKTGGTSAGSGGPLATSGDITDNTVVWNFIGNPAKWDFFAAFADTQSNPNMAIPVAIRNSANLPFDPPAMSYVSHLVISVTANMPPAALDSDFKLKIMNAVNITTWRGFPPRTCKITSYVHDGGKVKNGIPYTTTKWEIEVDPNTWDLRLLDCSYGYIDIRTPPGGGAQVKTFAKYVDIRGDSPDHPIPLNGKGQPLKPDDPPVFLRFIPRQQRLIDFNTTLPF